MRHANPHHAIALQPQVLIDQPVRVERAPPKAVIRGPLERLYELARVPAVHLEADHGEPEARVRAALAVHGDGVWFGVQVVQQRGL